MKIIETVKIATGEPATLALPLSKTEHANLLQLFGSIADESGSNFCQHMWMKLSECLEPELRAENTVKFTGSLKSKPMSPTAPKEKPTVTLGTPASPSAMDAFLAPSVAEAVFGTPYATATEASMDRRQTRGATSPPPVPVRSVFDDYVREVQADASREAVEEMARDISRMATPTPSPSPSPTFDWGRNIVRAGRVGRPRPSTPVVPAPMHYTDEPASLA